MDGNGVGQPLAVDEKRAYAVADFVVIRFGLLAAPAGDSLLGDILGFVVPKNQPSISVQQLIPDSMLFPRPTRKGSRHYCHARVQGANDLDVVPDVVRLDRRKGLCHARVVVSSPARRLRAADSHAGVRIDGAYRIRTRLQSASVGNIHPFLVVRPRGEILVRALHGFVRGHGDNEIPPAEIGSPLAIQGAQRSVALLEPDAHPGQRVVGKIEIPESGQIGNSGLVSQTVKDGAVGGVRASGLHQPVVNLLEPYGIGKARMALEGFFPGGVLLVELFGLEKCPVHGAVGIPAVILGIKIRSDVFRVPAQIVVEQELRRRLAPAAVLACIDPQLLELGEHLRAVLLPHDDRVIPPRAVRRPGDERYVRLFFTLVPVPFLIDAVEGEPNEEIILHCGRAPQVEQELHVGFIEELNRDLPVFHDAAVRVAPPDRKRSFSCRARIRAIVGRDRSAPLQGARRQNDFSGHSQG